MKISRFYSLTLLLTALAGATASANVSSNFDTAANGLDGWTLANSDPESTLVYKSTGGNPGGYILFTDGGQGTPDLFSAPAKFLGNDSAYLNGTLSFQLDDSQTANSLSVDPLTITDTAGDKLTLVITAPVAAQWNSFSFALNTSSGFIYDGGSAATQAQISTILTNVKSIYLPADIHNGLETDGLDNVTLAAVAPEPSTWSLLMAALVAAPFARNWLRRNAA
jgi:hypothetical protein